MKVLKIGITAVAIGLFSLTAVQAGSGTFKHSDGSKVKVKCTSAGCFETFTDAAGNKGKKIKVSSGGRTNFNKIKKAWNSKGYK